MASPRKRRERKAAKLAVQHEAKQRAENAVKAAQLVAQALEDTQIKKTQVYEATTFEMEDDFLGLENVIQPSVDVSTSTTKRRRITRKKIISKTK